ncbi:MAG: hypothetical protein QOD96_7728, partial [Pseudonocardiales bacterium]|nr:hypothetical protein [Pseudonocardiales bacterium]
MTVFENESAEHIQALDHPVRGTGAIPHTAPDSVECGRDLQVQPSVGPGRVVVRQVD